MLDLKIAELADRLIQIQFRERTQQLKHDISLVKSDAATRGMGTSSTVVQMVYELRARDVELRALIIWDNFRRVLSQAGIVWTDTLADDLKRSVANYSEAIFAEPHAHLEKLNNNVQVGYRPSLTAAHEQAVAKVDAEIDLLVMGLRRSESQPDTPAPIQLNISGNVGAVMTGPNANVSVSQSIGDQDRQALTTALDMIRNQRDRVMSVSASALRSHSLCVFSTDCIIARRSRP